MPETLLECEFGSARLYGDTALVAAGHREEVWRGPFRWDVGEHLVSCQDRGEEHLEHLGRVVSSFRLRPRSC